MSRMLPCGRPASWLVDVAAGERGAPENPADAAHLRSCPYCRAELAALQGRWAAVRRAASRPVRVPADLVVRTLSTVRAVRGELVRRHVETAQVGGVVRIAESALVLLTRRLAIDVVEGIPGVRFRGVSGGVDGLALHIAVRYGVSIADAANRVRRGVGAALADTLDTAVPALDVLVDDVLAPAGHR